MKAFFKKRSLFRRAFTGSLLALPLLAFAILDHDEDGMSDLWEKQYSFATNDNGTLHPDEAPLADPDGDGWNNLRESIAGTDPHAADPPDGFLQAQITPNPALAGVFTVSWPSLPGKQYTLFFSPDLTPESWLPVGDAILADGTPIEIAIESDSQAVPILFWRVAVENVDSDEDDLSDHEEALLHTDPHDADSDHDGNPDKDEVLAGTNPLKPDTDDDGIPDPVDLDPTTPRGPAPSVASPNSSGNPTTDLVAGDKVKFLLTVSNPAGEAPTASDLTLLINDEEESVSFEPLEDGQFTFTWTATTAKGYPDEMLQKLEVTFEDSEHAITTLKLAECDVAQWEGMIGQGVLAETTYGPGGPVEAEPVEVRSHHGGAWDTDYKNMGDTWYRGPKAVKLYRHSGIAHMDTNVTAQIGDTSRYPMFFISGTNTGTPVVEEGPLEISDPGEYPANALFIKNYYFRPFRIHYPDPDAPLTADSGGGFIHLSLPDATSLDYESSTIDLVVDTGSDLESDWLGDWSFSLYLPQRHRHYTTIYLSPPPSSSFAEFYDNLIYPSAHLIACGAGSTDYPGLPVDTRTSAPTAFKDPDSVFTKENSQLEYQLLPIGTEEWRKVVIKLGPDVGAISNGVELRVWSGDSYIRSARANPQAGFSLQVLKSSGLEALDVHSDGTISIATNDPIYSLITSKDGLPLFIKRTKDVTQMHHLSVDLLAMSNCTPCQVLALDLLPVDFITRSSTDPAVAIVTDGIGVTNQLPVVELDEVNAGQISISGDMATVPVGGIIRDALMDNIPDGTEADIVHATIYVNDEEYQTVHLSRSSDGSPSLWRNYPAKMTLPSTNVTVPASGVASIRVETDANAAGLKGSGEIIIEFSEVREPGTRVGAYTREYFLNFAGPMTDTVADILTLQVGSDPTIHTLVETGVNTRLFKTVAALPGQPPVRPFGVRLLSSYEGNPTQVEALQCEIFDPELIGGVMTSGPVFMECEETGVNTGIFRFYEDEPGMPGSYTITRGVIEVSQSTAQPSGGNYPFSFRVAGDTTAIPNLKLGDQSFETVDLDDFLHPELESGKQVNAYLIRNEAQDPAVEELLYYDATDSELKRIPLTGAGDELTLKIGSDEHAIPALTLKTGGLSFVGADGFPIQELNHVSAQTLVDLIDGDETVEIEDDSWEKIRVHPVGNPEDLTVRIKSSEIPSDYFDLKVNSTGSGKEAALVPVGGGDYESELKIVVYYSDEGIETLTTQQWKSLKDLGYLAVHNLSEEAWQIIRDIERDVTSQEIDKHHLFPQTFKARFAKLFPDLNIDDYTIQVDRLRHQKFSNGWNTDLKIALDEFTTEAGDLKPGADLKLARESVFAKILDPLDPESLCRKYHVNPSNPIHYSKKVKSTRDAFVRIISKYGGAKLTDGASKTTRILKRFTRVAGKGGKTILKKDKEIGLVIGAWTILTQGPEAAAAEFFDITPSGVETLLAGQGQIKLNSWDPQGSVEIAELRSHQVIKEGDAYYWADYGPYNLVGHVDEGEVDYIMPTEIPGVVDIFVRFGQELREYKSIDQVREGVPVEGQPWPEGW